jgi:hypothetical protein
MTRWFGGSLFPVEYRRHARRFWRLFLDHLRHFFFVLWQASVYFDPARQPSAPHRPAGSHERAIDLRGEPKTYAADLRSSPRGNN